MIRIQELELPVGADIDEIKKAAAKIIDVSPADFENFELARESIDSRHKNRIRMKYTVDVSVCSGEEAIILRNAGGKVSVVEKYVYAPPYPKRNSVFRPIIAGFGPAGMFAALLLAEAGYKPLIFERGEDVDARAADVDEFWRSKILNTESNIQFGEGGAGAFSDGKLTTGIKDPRVREVLNRLCEFGAPPEIKYSAKPHIGTDRLPKVVKNMRNEIIRRGGEVKFNIKIDDIYAANGAIHGVSAVNTKTGEKYDSETDCLILATGHSARDTVETLYKRGVKMEQKAFSVGVRIEHPQELINKAQYGKEYNNAYLGAAEYKLSNHPVHGRGAYTFCMCPGGIVVNAASEESGVVVNGMSVYARDGENANSAVLAGIEPDFFDGGGLFAGVEFQKSLEKAAFAAGGGGYAVPGQLLCDFIAGKATAKFGSVKPTCPTGVAPSNLRKILPEYVTNTIFGGIAAFDKKLPGFALPDAVLSAPETRSSSPLRILRDEFFGSSILGLYPCGEGAGYAGGIVSAAVDGIKVAEVVLEDAGFRD
ncbi:MAG: hypothetical protein FWF08_03325 [Oscillospiraceae bacterium]|nr:hypothetical protein [Oscillospiraceae bacterium]